MQQHWPANATHAGTTAYQDDAAFEEVVASYAAVYRFQERDRAQAAHRLKRHVDDHGVDDALDQLHLHSKCNTALDEPV